MEFWTSGNFWGISSFLELRDVKRPLGAPLEIPPPQYVRHYLVMSSAKKTHCVPALLPATPHIAAFTPSITLLNISSWHKGASIYDVRKIFGFVDPLPPPSHKQKSADVVPFVCFLGTHLLPPSPDVIYGRP